MVRRKPSSSPTSARKPKYSSARTVSSMRRGWPSGWSYPNDVALESGQLRDQRDQIPDPDLLSPADIDRLNTVIALGRKHDSTRSIVNVKELAAGAAAAPDLDLRCAAARAAQNFGSGPE